MIRCSNNINYEGGILMNGHKLNEFIGKFDRMNYVYDFGDDWIHEIKLIREIKKPQ
jgi:hypothetical protein